MVLQRKKTRTIYVGSVPIGGEHPIVVQSMTNTKTYDTVATLKQIRALHAAGCALVRIAVPTQKDALVLKELVQSSPVPLIADIHYDYTLALQAIESGIHALRINPGTMQNKEHAMRVLQACKEKNVPLRIGINAGSLEKHIIERYGSGPEAMLMSIAEQIRTLEAMDFTNFKVSLKSSSVLDTIAVYRLFAERFSYPLHVGVTEAGTLRSGTVKSSIGIGILLAEGIGDTIRVSLTGDPVEEVLVARDMLHALGLLKNKVEVIACPTCGRTEISLLPLVEAVEEYVQNIPIQCSVAVMGCPVNGVGEAKHADIGIAGGKDKAIIFSKGKIIRSVSAAQMQQEFLQELALFFEEKLSHSAE